MSKQKVNCAKGTREADLGHAVLSASGSHRWLNCTPSPVYVHCPQSTSAVHTLDNACKNIYKSSLVLWKPTTCNKLLDNIKFLLRDYSLMGIGYHFPFFGQLRVLWPRLWCHSVLQ